MVNIIIMGWVNLGMARVLEGMFGFNMWEAIIVCLLVTFAYTVIAGFCGVAATDAMQYMFEMGGAIALAVFALNAVGGLEGMKAGSPPPTPRGRRPGTARQRGRGARLLARRRDLGRARHHHGRAAHPQLVGLVVSRRGARRRRLRRAEHAGLQGRAPQPERRPLLQRRPLRAAQLALGHHRAVRALTVRRRDQDSAGVEDPGGGYVRIMVDILPPGLRGFMLASFAAAYMSTVATQMNWGSSYLTNDLYRRFIKRDATERHYVMVEVAVA